MSEKRRDNKNRILRDGESQRSDGRYMYKYIDNFGNLKYLYSWRLVSTDKTPSGKKEQLSLRDQIKLIQKDLNENINSAGSNITVLNLVKKYISQKVGVRENTKANYKTVINTISKDEFGYRKINEIKTSDAKEWLIQLQKNGKRYSTLHNIRGVVRPAFEMAVQDDLIRKNPFNFLFSEVVLNDSVARQAITKEQEKRFLHFLKHDPYYYRYYDAIYFLFKTGLRISEFCGLTVNDIDLENNIINIERQLQYRGKEKYWIEKVKTENGRRKIPVSDKNTGLIECMHRLIENRKTPIKEPIIDGISGFLFFGEKGRPLVGFQWSKIFFYAVQKFNSIYKEELPNITPHICRHTYCTNMVKAGVGPKALQKLMGHSSIEITLDIYTHYNLEDVRRELLCLDFGEL